MRENVIIGLDVGYGYTKAVAENRGEVCFPSVVAPAEFIRFQSDVGAPRQINGLALYGTADGDLFVGELATRQGRPGAVRSPRDRNRVADPIVTHLTDAAFGMLLGDNDYTPVSLVTGLPVDYYQDSHQLVEHLQGQHVVQFGEYNCIIDVHDVLVVPQPFGALLSVLLDERGKLMADAEYLVRGAVGVLDVGTYTTDLILVDGLEYIEAGSGSLEGGVSTMLEMLRKILLDEYRVSYEAHQLEVAIRRGWLVVDGEVIKLNGLAGEHLSTIAQAIEARARTLWNIGTLSAIVLAGGGALALRPWLEPYFRQAIYAPDAAMANVVGFLRYGLRRWR